MELVFTSPGWLPEETLRSMGLVLRQADIPGGDVPAVGPVSYTHLDVYKRQEHV